MSVNEIDFRERYSSSEDLADDEKRDLYPPRFITQLHCHKLSSLDVEYVLHVKQDGRVIKNYKFSIVVTKTVPCEGKIITTKASGM